MDVELLMLTAPALNTIDVIVQQVAIRGGDLITSQANTRFKGHRDA